MASCNIDIRIGVDGTENKEFYKNIDVSIELHQEKLIKINQDLATLLGKTVTPFIIIEFPDIALENNQIFNFKTHDYQSVFLKANNKLYQYCNPRNKDTTKLLKNVEKEFQKLNKLNNNCNLKLSLYNILREEQPQEGLLLLNHCKIKGGFQGDPELVSTLTEIIRRISNEFLNSPFMAFLELLENMNVKINLAQVQQFSQQLKEDYLSWLNFNSWVNKDKLAELQKVKGDIIINITLPKLFNIKIKSQATILGAFLSIFP